MTFQCCWIFFFFEALKSCEWIRSPTSEEFIVLHESYVWNATIRICRFVTVDYLVQAEYEKEEEKLEEEIKNARSSLTKYQTELGMKRDQMVSNYFVAAVVLMISDWNIFTDSVSISGNRNRDSPCTHGNYSTMWKH